MLVQVLEGDAGVYLKFIAKGESEPVDSPGELWVTVRTWSRHAAPCLHAWGAIDAMQARALVAVRSEISLVPCDLSQYKHRVAISLPSSHKLRYLKEDSCLPARSLKASAWIVLPVQAFRVSCAHT